MTGSLSRAMSHGLYMQLQTRGALLHVSKVTNSDPEQPGSLARPTAARPYNIGCCPTLATKLFTPATDSLTSHSGT